jgi:hypothetical protein
VGADSRNGGRIRRPIHITHRDEVESPFTDWLLEAYDLPDKLAARSSTRPTRRVVTRATPKRAKKRR